MSDKTVLLEERKEITTFLLDEGDITETVNVLPNGNIIGYDYSGVKIHAEDVVTLSSKSQIGKIHVRRYCEDNEDCLIFGIAVNNPLTMTGGKRKTAILILGHIFRFKLASGIKNINVKDRIALTPNGAVVNDAGTCFAMHPVEDSDKYHFVEVFLPYNSSACMSEPIPPCGTYWQTTTDESFSDISQDLSQNMINAFRAQDVAWASDNDGEFYVTGKPGFYEDPVWIGGLLKKGSDVFYNDPMRIRFNFKMEGGLLAVGFGFCFAADGTFGLFAGVSYSNPAGITVWEFPEDLYLHKDSQVTLSADTTYKMEISNNPEDEYYMIKTYSENNELLSTININKDEFESTAEYGGLDLSKPIYFGMIIYTYTDGGYVKKFIISDVEILTPIRN